MTVNCEHKKNNKNKNKILPEHEKCKLNKVLFCCRDSICNLIIVKCSFTLMVTSNTKHNFRLKFNHTMYKNCRASYFVKRYVKTDKIMSGLMDK